MSRKRKHRKMMPYHKRRKGKRLGKPFEALLALSFVLLFMGVLTTTVTQIQKVEPIEERINSATAVTETFESIRRVRTGRSAASRYEIKTVESDETYIVGSIAGRFFPYRSFVDNVKPGTPITLLASSANIKSGNRLVYAVSSGEQAYLTTAGTIRAHEDNDSLGVIMGWPFLVIGLLLCSTLWFAVRPRLLR